MAKNYRITLTPKCKCNEGVGTGKEIECQCGSIPITGNPGKTKEIRVEEIEILIGSCLLGADNTKDMKEMIQGFSLARDIEKIKGELYIEVTSTELKVIRSGLELSAGERPGSWAYCINLFNQIVSPEEVPGE